MEESSWLQISEMVGARVNAARKSSPGVPVNLSVRLFLTAHRRHQRVPSSVSETLVAATFRSFSHQSELMG